MPAPDHLARVLGLDVDLHSFYRLVARDHRLAVMAARFRGMRPPRIPSVLEATVNAIACQQLSLTVGIHLLNRPSRRFGSATPGHDPRQAAFPAAAQLAGADPTTMRELGFSRAKARALIDLGRRVEAGTIDLEALGQMSDDGAREALLELTGIGRWSAE